MDCVPTYDGEQIKKGDGFTYEFFTLLLMYYL